MRINNWGLPSTSISWLKSSNFITEIYRRNPTWMFSKACSRFSSSMNFLYTSFWWWPFILARPTEFLDCLHMRKIAWLTIRMLSKDIAWKIGLDPQERDICFVDVFGLLYYLLYVLSYIYIPFSDGQRKRNHYNNYFWNKLKELRIGICIFDWCFENEFRNLIIIDSMW